MIRDLYQLVRDLIEEARNGGNQTKLLNSDVLYKKLLKLINSSEVVEDVKNDS